MSFKKLVTLGFYCLFALNLFAGLSPIKPGNYSTKEEKKWLNEAKVYLKNSHYTYAIVPYTNMLEKNPDDLYLKFELGVCYLYKSDEYPKALQYFREVYQVRPKTKDLTFYLGRALHLNSEFDEAISFFNLHLKEGISSERKKDVQRLIKNCENAKEFYKNPTEVEITNIGSPVNTEDDEYVPIISADESVLIFTYRGPRSTGGMMDNFLQPDYQTGTYYEDIFIAYKDEDGNWMEPEPIGPQINTLDHDACVALSSDGQTLYIYKFHKNDKGDIWVSNLTGDQWSAPERLQGDVNSSHWDGSASLSADGKYLYFSSERPGGYGGKDIYVSEKNKKGVWGNVKNLGPSINTPFDDDAPFIHPNGTILHFSSKGHNSMGGYDIFSADLIDGKWLRPVNLGFPINTVDDDIYYVLNAEGTVGYYSSGKPGGQGKKDIYTVKPGLVNKRSVMMLVKGIVTVDDNPVYADIEVVFADSKTEQGEYHTNESTGKYLINFQSENNYIITYKVKGFDPKIERVSTMGIDTFIEKVIDIKLYTGKASLKKDSVAEVADNPEAGKNEIIKTEFSSEDIISKYGNFVLEGLTYRVQVGAYRVESNFKYDHLNPLGQVEVMRLDDDITRFVMKTFSTLNEANAFKDKVIAKGGLTTDSFVIAIYNNKRVYLSDLIREGIIPEK
jgi:Tol biopolymer transport system component